MKRSIVGVGAAACLLGGAACGKVKGTDQVVTEAELIQAAATPSGAGWQSAPFPTEEDCDADRDVGWVRLGGGVSLEVSHGLGRTPSVVFTYLSFERSGCRAVLAAGDMARVEWADDAVVRIHNATEEPFFARLVLR